MSSQASSAPGVAKSAVRRSVGTACTTPAEIFFGIFRQSIAACLSKDESVYVCRNSDLEIQCLYPTFMKYLACTAGLFTLVFLGAGCEEASTEQSPSPLPPVVQELQTQPVPSSTKQETRDPAAIPLPAGASTALYTGSWFDVKYPQTFSATPNTPTTTYNGQTFVQTDEATFTSPDGSIEFFVYSPQWSGTPKTYLTVLPTEELVDEQVQETPETNTAQSARTRWVTIKAKDGSYYRSFVSLQKRILTQDSAELHHVFGIKYRDAAAYETYKTAYSAFKQSLRQYAD